MTETNLVDQLIQTAIADHEAQVVQRQGQIYDQVRQLQECIIAALGDLWPVLEPYRQAGSYDVRNEQVYLTVPFEPIELRLSRFYLSASTHGCHVQLSTNPGFDSYRRGNDLEHLADFLLRRRQEFPEWRRKQLDGLAAPHINKLSFLTSSGTSEQADQALVELLNIDPERSDLWQTLRQDWQAKYDQHQERQRQEAVRAAQLEVAKTAFTEAYRAFLTDYCAILQVNRQVAQVHQDELNTPRTLYRLTYALLAQDEDGGQFLETRQVVLSGPDPDPDGYYPRLENCSQIPTRYFHPVSIQPFTAYPLDGNYQYACQLYLHQAEASLWYWPDDQKAVGELVLSLKALPAAPGYDPLFDDWTYSHHLQQVKSTIQTELAGQFDFEIKFPD